MLTTNPLTVQGLPLDDPTRPFLIAEVSANHAQDLTRAHHLVDAAAMVGADAIKFQTFTPEEIAADVPILRGYEPAHDRWLDQLRVTRLRELFAAGGLPRAWHQELQRHATDKGLVFCSTPFSVDAAKFLVEEVGVPLLKIASGDLTFTPLVAYAASTRLPLLLSTGCATLAEIAGVLDALPQGCRPVLLHCVSAYPHPSAAANLRALHTLRRYFRVPVGYSDHTVDVMMVPAMAVALGVTVYEKHFRLEGGPPTPDTEHSVTIAGFRQVWTVLREAPAILGRGDRHAPHPLEAHERLWTRRAQTDWLRPTEAAREGQWA